jgi:arylsulfatase A-like enzyme
MLKTFASIFLFLAFSFSLPSFTPRVAKGNEASTSKASTERGRPNVLFIAIDDLNDWIGCLGGHPQAHTPHLDRLAQRATNFTNAHCQAPICNPSRVSLLTGVLPSSTGIYYLGPQLRECEATRRATSLPQHFQRNGYQTRGAGKIFHAAVDGEFDVYAGSFGGFGPRPETNFYCGHVNPLWDWGAFPQDDAQMPDAKIAAWAIDQLQQPTSDRPFFLACGFYRPHVPLYVPPAWFELHPLDKVQLPAHQAHDLSDVPTFGQDLSWSAVAPRHDWMVSQDQWRRAVQSYLASVSFVDAQVGKVLDALESSQHAKNTIVVVWSDHGFHLGTKQRWGKRSLWEAATQVVMMIDAPGLPDGARCDAPVGLIDLFPTLCELADIPTATGLEGRSLLPLLHNAQRPWPYPALTTFGQHNHAVRSQHWRYITYADGTEELYDHRTDPDEFHNVAGIPTNAAVIAAHRDWLPQVNQPLARGSVHLDARPGSVPDIDGQPIFPRRPVVYGGED